jgi:two-component system, OmpR family, KDP operon response regulator KdpE
VHGGRAAAVRVLVLDDNPSIRLLCRVNLELDGFDVVEAASLAEARDALAGGDVKVVVLDLHLRGEQSFELFAECRAADPPIPIVLVTGSIDLGGGGAPEADVVLGKPFEIEELVARVRELAGRD